MNWAETCNIRPTLKRIETEELTLVQGFDLVGTELRKTKAFQRDLGRIQRLVHDFEHAPESWDLDDGDDLLAQLYDWADKHRVWLGLPE
jgi:hypothetical protein